MADTKINLKRENGSLLPDGVYRLKVDGVEEKQGPSGFPYLNIRYKPIVNGAVSNQAVWDVISLSPQARFKVDQFLDSLNAPSEGDVSPRWFEGKMVWATLIAGEYNGNVRNEVQAYLPSEIAQQMLENSGQQVVGTGGGEPVQRKKTGTSKTAAAHRAASTGERQPVVEANMPAEMDEEEFPV